MQSKFAESANRTKMFDFKIVEMVLRCSYKGGGEPSKKM